MSVEDAYLTDLWTHIDARGKLTVVEGGTLPFDIERVYYIYDVPEGEPRGVHGHRELQQLMICLHGSVRVTLHDGRNQRVFELDRPWKGLYVPPMSWRCLEDFTPDTVCLILASMPYSEVDYFFSFDEFLKAVRRGNDGGEP
jgi:dTDP-4-dehydrorhamnose 3,5-epimerase-like enzyme